MSIEDRLTSPLRRAADAIDNVDPMHVGAVNGLFGIAALAEQYLTKGTDAGLAQRALEGAMVTSSFFALGYGLTYGINKYKAYERRVLDRLKARLQA